MGSSHHTAEDLLEVPLRTRRVLLWIVVLVGVATLVGLALTWPSRDVSEGLTGFTSTYYDGQIEAVEVVPCPGPAEDDASLRCAELDVVVLEGPDEGRLVALDLFDAASADLSEGERIVLEHDPSAGEGFEYRFSDRDRSSVLLWLALLFALAVIVLGRLRGLAALAGLGLTLAVLLIYTVPALVDGTAPLLVALISASAISYCAIYLAHGFNSMSTVALLGTLGALALTAGLATLFVDLARITGLASEEAAFLQLGAGQIDLRGLILAGVIIGALGALDDMTVTQASAVWELRAANSRYTSGELYRSGIRIGRDHVAATVNTLVLAYAGAAMPLLLLFSITEQPLLTIANSELMATEIVRTLVGSIGLVASVPLTTGLAVLAARRALPADRSEGTEGGSPGQAPTG